MASEMYSLISSQQAKSDAFPRALNVEVASPNALAPVRPAAARPFRSRRLHARQPVAVPQRLHVLCRCLTPNCRRLQAQRRAYSVKRMACIGCSVVAAVVVMLVLSHMFAAPRGAPASAATALSGVLSLPNWHGPAPSI